MNAYDSSPLCDDSTADRSPTSVNRRTNSFSSVNFNQDVANVMSSTQLGENDTTDDTNVPLYDVPEGVATNSRGLLIGLPPVNSIEFPSVSMENMTVINTPTPANREPAFPNYVQDENSPSSIQNMFVDFRGNFEEINNNNFNNNVSVNESAVSANPTLEASENISPVTEPRPSTSNQLSAPNADNRGNQSRNGSYNNNNSFRRRRNN